MDKSLATLIVALARLAAVAAHAATGGGGLPWATPLQTLSNSLSGPVAYTLSLIGLVVSGGVLIFMGGEGDHFARGVVQVGAVISLLIDGKNTKAPFGGGDGAESGANEEIEEQRCGV